MKGVVVLLAPTRSKRQLFTIPPVECYRRRIYPIDERNVRIELSPTDQGSKKIRNFGVIEKVDL